MTRFQAVSETLNTYFDGLHFADPDRLRQVFHPQAIYASADETPLLYRNMPDYFEVVAQRIAPAARNEPREDSIDSIEFAGDNTALARVRCAIGDRSFTDFLTLVQTGGEWRIMSKIFQISARKT